MNSFYRLGVVNHSVPAAWCSFAKASLETKLAFANAGMPNVISHKRLYLDTPASRLMSPIYNITPVAWVPFRSAGL